MSVLDIVLIVIMTVLLAVMLITVVWLLVLPLGFFDDEPENRSRKEDREDDIQ